MTQRLILPLTLAFALPLAACQQEASEEPAALESPTATEAAADAAAPAASFTEDAKLRFTGTEPFWGGNLDGTSLTYTTPENIDGTTFAVERSGANGVLTLTGTLDGGPFEMAISEGRCSDGMSDRTYPLTVTLTVGGEVRKGCAWSEAHPFEGPVNP